MFENLPQDSRSCPRIDIGAYLDGELDPAAEIGLERHVAQCAVCREELNEHKRLTFALDSALEHDDPIEIPENFAKVVTTNAECKVEGLRCPVERNRALLVSLMLGLIVIVGVAADSKSGFGFVGAAADRTLAVASFFLHLTKDLAVATSVILRSVCPNTFYNSALSFGAVIVTVLVAIIILAKFLRQNRF